MFKLPKKVIINNIPFKVTRNRKMSYSEFVYDKSEITIGSSKLLSDREQLMNYIHEVAEIAMIERGMRCKRCKPTVHMEEYVFTGGHREFADVISDVSGALADLMNLE